MDVVEVGKRLAGQVQLFLSLTGLCLLKFDLAT